MTEPFFFGSQLFGVWREPPDAHFAWVLVPPFAEEEKGTRRVFTEIAQLLASRGGASLVFSPRGQGDSGGDFSSLGLDEWREDVNYALDEARRRLPRVGLGLLGVRLSAALALQVAATRSDLSELVLIDPLLSGRTFLSQQLMRQKIRAQMTQPNAGTASRNTEVDDLDGWPLSAKMKADLNALDLQRAEFKPSAPTRVFQVGPKAEVAPSLRALSEKLGASVEAVVSPPFWNLLDYSSPRALLEKL